MYASDVSMPVDFMLGTMCSGGPSEHWLLHLVVNTNMQTNQSVDRQQNASGGAEWEEFLI